MEMILKQNEIERSTTIEDEELLLNSKIEINKNFIFLGCRIVIDADASAELEIKEGSTTFEDCEIIIKGKLIQPLIKNVNGKLLFEECSFVQEDTELEQKGIFVLTKAINQKIEFSDCSIDEFFGIFVCSSGTDIFVEKTKVSNLTGSFMMVNTGKDYTKPSVAVRECSFKNCKNQSKNDIALITVGTAVSVRVEKTSFHACNMCCINLKDGEVRAQATISDCIFENCNHKEEGWPTTKIIDTFRYIVLIKNCTFKKISGIYIAAQLVRAEIIDCHFVECKKDELAAGFLTIHVEVDEPIILIKNCLFNKCINKDTYDSGIIYLGSGMVERRNRETVLIDNCKFENCQAKKEIRGVEKQDGFFGSSIKLFKYV